MTHTPTPWSTSVSFPATVTDGNSYLFNGVHSDKEVNKANAHRIVACVNACADFQDPAKEIAELKARVERQAQLIRDLKTRFAGELHQTPLNSNPPKSNYDIGDMEFEEEFR